LAGRPDRIVKEVGEHVPEDCKQAVRVDQSHAIQGGRCFILIGDETGSDRMPVLINERI
jgi:hypothetical protein